MLYLITPPVNVLELGYTVDPMVMKMFKHVCCFVASRLGV